VLSYQNCSWQRLLSQHPVAAVTITMAAAAAVIMLAADAAAASRAFALTRVID